MRLFLANFRSTFAIASSSFYSLAGTVVADALAASCPRVHVTEAENFHPTNAFSS